MNGLYEFFEDKFQLIPPRIIDADYEMINLMKTLDCEPNGGLKYLPRNTLPVKKSLPISKIRNQGNIGSCTGFAATGCLETLYMIYANTEINLSEQYCYSQNKLHDPWRGVWYSGSSTLTASRILRDFGVCHENVCKYVSKEFVKPTEAMNKDAELRKCCEVYYLDNTIRDDIIHAIAQDMPVLIAIKMFTGFSDSKLVDDKVVELGKIKKSGHAIMIFGYDSLGVFIKNSWGESYGKGGTVHVKWDILLAVLKTAIAIKGLRKPFSVEIPKVVKPKKKRCWRF